MACLISIEGTVAYRAVNNSNVNRIVVWGTALDCTGLTANITFGGDEFQASANFVVPGGWVASVDVSNSGLSCGEIADIDLDVVCTQGGACSAHTKVDVLQCQAEGGCPTWDKFNAALVDASDAGCIDGARQVRIEARLPPDVPPGLGPIFAQFYIRPIDGGAEIPLAAVVPAAGETIFAETMLPGGTYAYGLRVFSPAPCEGPTGVIEVPACPGAESDDPALCPQVTLGSFSVAEHCTPSQQRMVTASAVVTPEPGHPASAQLVVKDVDTVVLILDSADGMSDETVLNGTGPVSPGVYTVGVDVTDPQACNYSGQQMRVALCGSGADPDKPGGEVDQNCPEITLDAVQVSDSCADGQRTVTASASVIGQSDFPATAALVVKDGDAVIATLDSVDGATGPADLAGSADLSPGDYSVAVDVAAPSGCNGQSEQITVAPCPGEDTGGGDGFQIPWCLIALIVALVILILGAVVFGIAFCVIGFLTNPYAIAVGIAAIVIGLILLVLGNILFLIWLFTCGSCRLNCGHLNWLQILFSTLAAGSAVLAFIGWLLAQAGLSALCFVGWGIDTINFALLALLVTYWRKVAGCDPWPPGWPRWLRITLPPALTNLCRR